MSDTLRIDGDGSGAVKVFTDIERSVAKLDDALEKAAKEAGGLEKGTEKVGKAAEGAAKSQRQLILEAQKIKEALDPQERLNRKYAELKQHVEAGRLSMSQSIQEGIKLRQAFYEASEEGKKAAAESAASAAAKLKATKESAAAEEAAAKRERQNTDARVAARKRAIAAAEQEAEAHRKLLAQGEKIKQSLETPTERYKRQVLELGQALRKGAVDKETFIRGVRSLKSELEAAKPALEEASEAAESSFSTKAATKVAAFAGGLFSVGEAIGLLKTAFTEVEQKAESAASRIVNVLGSAGELQQLGSEEYAKNAAYARSLARTGAVDLGQAFDISMNLGSAGYTDEEKEFFRKVVDERIVKAENLDNFGSNLRRIQNIYGDKGGSLEDIYSRVSVAGDEAITDINTTARSLTTFGSAARDVGVGNPEALAAFIVSEGQSKSPDAASEKLLSFFSQVDKRNVADGDIPTILSAIKKRQDKGESLYDILGEQNAVRGYTDLANGQGRLQELTDRLNGAPSSGIFADQAAAMDQDPQLRIANLRARREAELRQKEEERKSQAGNLAATIYAEQQNEAIEQGLSREIAAAVSWKTKTTYGVVESAFKDINAAEFTGESSPYSPETTREIIEFMRRQTEASERTAEAVESLEGKRRGAKAAKTKGTPARK